MKNEYNIRAMQWVHYPADKTWIDEMAITVKIDEEGGGEFVTLESMKGELSIEPEEWPTLRNVIDVAFQEIQKHEGKENPA